MRNAWKKILGIAAAVCLTLSCGALAACGEPTGEQKSYTVTVLSPYDVAVDDVTVKFGGASVKTGDDGKATVQVNAGSYSITLENLPDVYTYDTVKTTDSETNYTVKLKLKTAPEGNQVLYTVKIVYPDGSPVKGAMPGLCDDTQCIPFMGSLTNDRGEAYKAFDPNTYSVQVLSGIDGYTYDVDAENHYAGGVATAQKPYIKVVLKKA